jgi:hypothetical protein
MSWCVDGVIGRPKSNPVNVLIVYRYRESFLWILAMATESQRLQVWRYGIVLRNEVDEMAIPLKLSLSRECPAPLTSLFHDSS